MLDWQDDKAWTEPFIPQVKGLLGRHLLTEAPIEDDQHRNTDFIVLKMAAVRIACRIRRHEHLQYGDEFTIRSWRPKAQTELAKVREGFGDYLFYGFGDDATRRVTRWLIGDLGVFRAWLEGWASRHGGRLPGREMANGDQTRFRAFKVVDLPDGFVVGSNWNAAEQRRRWVASL